ncbi:MAG: class I SAM-dependent methyltransferase [Planctomycetes bacterium]|nr:class I SAM-dependent methyltransferase [Planctomycetota bacterium]
MHRTSSSVREKWQAPEVARHYAEARFRSRRAEARDPRLVAQLLEHAVPSPERVLDVPCGTGRLFPTLAARGASIVGLDASREMLAHTDRDRPVVQGDALALPFADASFDAVVCCRLAHHLHRDEDLSRLLDELARVARRWVLLSFWDAGALPTWRKRVGLKRNEGTRGRLARSRRELAHALDAAGLEPREYRTSLRFVSQQTFVLAEKR